MNLLYRLKRKLQGKNPYTLENKDTHDVILNDKEKDTLTREQRLKRFDQWYKNKRTI